MLALDFHSDNFTACFVWQVPHVCLFRSCSFTSSKWGDVLTKSSWNKNKGRTSAWISKLESVSWVYGSAEKGKIDRGIIEAVGVPEPWEWVKPWIFMQLRFLHGHVVLCVPRNIIHRVSDVAMLFTRRYYEKITWCSQSHVALESFQMQHCCTCLPRFAVPRITQRGLGGATVDLWIFFFFLLKGVEVWYSYML